jgi:hypothetical protein
VSTRYGSDEPWRQRGLSEAEQRAATRPDDFPLLPGGELAHWRAHTIAGLATGGRPSPATYITQAGGLVTAAPGVLRDEAYYPSDKIGGIPERCVLVESARTNAFTASEDIADAAWTKTNVSPGSPIVAPDGALTAKALTETLAANTSHRLTRAVVNATLGQPQAFSLFVAPGTGPNGRRWVMAQTAFGLAKNTWVNVLDRVLGSASGFHTMRLRGLAAPWMRLHLTVAGGVVTAAPGSFFVYMAQGNESATSVQYTGDGASAIYPWGLQHERDAGYVTSYIPSAQGSRAADAWTLTGYTLPDRWMHAATLARRFFDLATWAWTETRESYTSDAPIVLADATINDRAYTDVAILMGDVR